MQEWTAEIGNRMKNARIDEITCAPGEIPAENAWWHLMHSLTYGSVCLKMPLAFAIHRGFSKGPAPATQPDILP